MEIVEKFYTLTDWHTSRINRFPKQARVLIGQPLQERLFFVLDHLIEAVYTPNRESLLRQVNIGLDRVVTFAIRWKFRYITRNRAEVWQKKGKTGIVFWDWF